MHTDQMTKQVQKRTGELVPFDAEKIRKALEKAFASVNDPRTHYIETITDKVLKYTVKKRTYHVEEIQDKVEEALMTFGLHDIARAYIVYRRQHEDLRNMSFILSSHDLVNSYLGLDDWRVSENANMSYSIQGLNNYVSSLITSNYWLHRIYPKGIRDAHLSGDLHIHDLGILAVYCCGWDLKDLLLRGFAGAPGKIQSGPAKHFRTALGQIVNFFYTLQGEAAGAQAFANFDTLLAPFVRFDRLSLKEVKQALQEFVFNINVPTRVGFQTPFTNITMDLTVPSNMKDEAVIHAGACLNSTYKEFQHEMDLINIAFAEVMMEGDAKGRVFTFPIPTYNITKDFNWDSETLKPIWQMTAKYGIPYFSNFVNSDLSPDDARSMCCRLRLDNRELIRRGGGLFGSNPLTGSIGVVTINLPRIGHRAKDKEDYFAQLVKQMDLAKESLIIKRKVLEQFTARKLYPYAAHYLAGIHERFGAYWSNHFSTIGIIGMHECAQNLLRKGISTAEGHALAQETLDFMRARIKQYQEETGSLFNLEATPAEGTSCRLAKLDRQRYPDCIVANGKEMGQGTAEAPYYTNSTHLPVNHTDDLFEALDLQDDLQTRYTGGTVLHLFLGERIADPQAVKSLVRRITSQYHLPYFTFTPTFSVCPSHGYLTGEQKHCPECNSACEIYSRIVGYIRPVQNWNVAKKEEFADRLTYQVPI